MRKFLFVSLITGLSFLLGAAPVQLHCWIVRSANGETDNSVASISNEVAVANRCFSQVGMSFEIASINSTNNTDFLIVDSSNSEQYRSLCDVTNNTGGVEVYFVNRVIGAVAFWTTKGIVFGKYGADDFTLAHELGHACGLDDIYESHSGTSLTVSGPPDKLRFTHDWGWYPENLTQADIVSKLLMYGYSSNTKGDISRGDVYGLWYQYVSGTTNKVWQLGLAPVGFKLHGNRHPVSE